MLAVELRGTSGDAWEEDATIVYMYTGMLCANSQFEMSCSGNERPWALPSPPPR